MFGVFLGKKLLVTSVLGEDIVDRATVWQRQPTAASIPLRVQFPSKRARSRHSVGHGPELRPHVELYAAR